MGLTSGYGSCFLLHCSCGMHEVGAFMGPGDSGKGEEDSSEMEILMKDCN